ncbi:hypothetical protein D3C73_607430 [compost metagenome]
MDSLGGQLQIWAICRIFLAIDRHCMALSCLLDKRKASFPVQRPLPFHKSGHIDFVPTRGFAHIDIGNIVIEGRFVVPCRRIFLP